MDVGLNYAEAALWADHLSPADLDWPEVVRSFLDAGFSGREGLRWWFFEFTPPWAVEFAESGWGPEQADQLVSRCRPGGRWRRWAFEPVAASLTDASRWLDSGIAPHWCLLYVSAGCSTEQATAFEARRAAGEAIDSGLRLLAALRGEAD